MFDVALSFISRTLHHSSLSFFLHCLSFAVHVSPVLKDRPQLVVVTSVQDVKICRPFMQHNIGMSWEWRGNGVSPCMFLVNPLAWTRPTG